MNKSIDDIDFEKSGGIVPVIVQDANTKDVLTLAYSNKESLELAKKTGKSWFWSRSRNKLWMKGEESGNTQKIKEMYYQGDNSETSGRKAIMGALRLYLDFINLFILLLQLFGSRR